MSPSLTVHKKCITPHWVFLILIIGYFFSLSILFLSLLAWFVGLDWTGPVRLLYWYTNYREEEIPDPIKLLRRIAALESAVVALRKESTEVRQKRNQISVEVTDLLCQNAQTIDQVRPSVLQSDC
jgi:hypothetical protein